MKTLPFWLVPALALVGASTRAADMSRMPQMNETEAQRESHTAWWREARFGMFIHWGPVSLKETEISWSRANSNPKCPNKGPIPVEVYDNLYKQFNPTQFDARAWVALARAAHGMWADRDPDAYLAASRAGLREHDQELAHADMDV